MLIMQQELLTSPMLKYGSYRSHDFKLRLSYVGKHMCRVVRYMHDICAIHIRRNCVHGHPKLLVV